MGKNDAMAQNNYYKNVKINVLRYLNNMKNYYTVVNFEY